MKRFLFVTALIEGVTGLALIAAPSIIVSLLVGTALNESSGMLLSRLAGIALVSLSIICWLYRTKETASGIVKAMVFYNVAAAALLVYGQTIGFSGLALWPAVLLHLGLGVRCIKILQRNSGD